MDFMDQLASQLANKLMIKPPIMADSKMDAVADMVASKVSDILGNSNFPGTLARGSGTTGSIFPAPTSMGPVIANSATSDYIASKVAFHLQKGQQPDPMMNFDIEKLAQLVSDKMKTTNANIPEKDIDVSKEQDVK